MTCVREYIVHETPNGNILLDWGGNTWKFGYPYYPKSQCKELERGMCEGGKNLLLMATKMRKKYRRNNKI